MTASPALEVRVVRKIHAGLTLDVALHLGRECGVVFGPSGAGKTTLLRLIAGLSRPDSGYVRVSGDSLFDATARVDRPLRDRHVAFVFQDDLLFPHRDVAGNIRFGLKGRPRVEIARRVAEVAALCGVEHLLDRWPATLSGGERQRVGLARALAPRPRLLLCDEPVSALDLDAREAMVDRLKRVQQVESIPVVYVTHSPSEALALGSRLFLLEAGRFVAEGPPLDVLSANRSGSLAGVRNAFPAVVAGGADEGATRLKLGDGLALIVPRLDLPEGTAVVVSVLAEEVLLATGPVPNLSARNVIEGAVARVVPHDGDAEIVVLAGGLTWLASVVAPAVAALGLQPGANVALIIKARSCHVRVKG